MLFICIHGYWMAENKCLANDIISPLFYCFWSNGRKVLEEEKVFYVCESMGAIELSIICR